MFEEYKFPTEELLTHSERIQKQEENLVESQIIEKTLCDFGARGKVVEVFKGNLSGELEIMSYGGVISVNDYIRSKLPGESIDAKYINLTEEEKEKTFVKIINSFTMSTIEPEVGKYYLVFMNYNNDLECYQVLDDLIYEYDITNNTTKNTDTNEWEYYEFEKNKIGSD